MAEKHKSKYKKPENTKPTYRKDLKDYTLDDKDGKLNPYSTGDKQLNVLRKTDKKVVDNGSLVPKYDADDRLYKDLEDGEYDPKTAAKRLKKRQDSEEKEVADVLHDKLENLTREQKERIVREYVRRKIERILLEQTEPESPETETPETETPAEEPAPETPAEEPLTDDPAAETPDMSAAPSLPSISPAPSAPVDASAEAPAPPAEAPAGETPAEEMDSETKEAIAIEKFIKHLRDETGNISRIKSISKVINSVMKNADPDDYRNFYEMLRSLAIKKLSLNKK
jgi:hypothetical protein